MTNITELAQSLKAAAEKASDGDWVKESGDGWEAACSANDQANGGFIIAHFEGPDAAENREFVQAANPANIIALVEALEKAQTINAAAEKLVRCKGRYHSEQNYRALAALFGVNTPDLPPLDGEPRAVTVENLQESAYRAGLTAGWNLGLANNNDGFNKCLAAHTAGIKWEAE